MNAREILSGNTPARPRLRTAYRRRRVDPARFLAVVVHLPAPTLVPRRRNKHAVTVCVLACLAGFLCLAVWIRSQSATPAAPAEVFVFEETPPATPTPPPDPSPPPQPVSRAVEPVAPPPQFGMHEEAISASGDIAVATGNTLMTEADSVVKEPVAALPAQPQNLDQAPRILKGRPPEYPARALERGLEATVIVLITIDTLGRVSQVEIERSGGRDFDPDVIRSVRGLVFQPPVRNGQRTSARFRQPYEFTLQ